MTGVVITPPPQDRLILPRFGWDVETDDVAHPLTGNTGNTGEYRAASQAGLKMDQGAEKGPCPRVLLKLIKE